MSEKNTSETRPWKILIVEDEKPLAHALRMKLEHEGYLPVIAENGRAGLEEVLKGGYDIMLLDIVMPELDGFEVLQRLREEKNDTPVLVLSNLGQEEDRERVKKLGALDYFVKASTPIADIVKRIQEILT